MLPKHEKQSKGRGIPDIYSPSAPVIYMAGLYRLEKKSDLPLFVVLIGAAA